MFGKEVQHVRFTVIGLLAQGLVGECALASVALQGTLADLEQQAQVLIVEKPDAFGQGRWLLPLRLYRQQQLVLTVKAVEDFLHPALEVVAGKQFHISFPPSFAGFPAARPQGIIMEQGVYRFFLVPDGIRFQQSLHFGEAVAASAAYYHIFYAVVIPHPLQGTGTHVQQFGGLGCIEQAVFRRRILTLFLLFQFADISGYLRYLFHHSLICGTLDCYHFHIQLFLLFLWQSSAINKDGFNSSLRDSRKIFMEMAP